MPSYEVGSSLFIFPPVSGAISHLFTLIPKLAPFLYLTDFMIYLHLSAFASLHLKNSVLKLVIHEEVLLPMKSLNIGIILINFFLLVFENALNDFENDHELFWW